MPADEISFTSAISAGDKGRQGEQALALLHKMRAHGMTVNVISFIFAAISACEKGRRWEQTMVQSHEMRDTSMLINVISFSAAISTGGTGFD